MTDPRYDDPTAPLVPQLTPIKGPSIEDTEAIHTELAEMQTRLARIEQALEAEQ